MFSAVSAIWVHDGRYLIPSKPLVHPLRARSYAAADREVLKLALPVGRKLWAYGPTEQVVKNCSGRERPQLAS